jgi:hypothetical protein
MSRKKGIDMRELAAACSGSRTLTDWALNRAPGIENLRVVRFVPPVCSTCFDSYGLLSTTFEQTLTPAIT